jgi:CDP-diacylglycerol--glycerol-3-phosphate 3-phosphatidyltransferase
VSASTIRQDILNIPNLLTLFRIALIPLVCFLIYDGSPASCLWAFSFFWIASITDWFDGYIARRQNLVSLTGKFLDPLADKLLIMAVLIMLVSLGRMDAWLVIVILAREISITSLRALAAGEGMVIASGEGGKYKTSFQMLGLIALITHYEYVVDYGFYEFRLNFHRLGYWLLLLSVIFSMSSAWEYVRGFIAGLDEVKGEPDPA